MDAGEVQGVGLGRAHRDLRRALPDAEGAAARDGRADAVQGGARGAGARRRSDLGAEGRAAAHATTPTPSTATSPAPLVYVNYGRPVGLRGARAPRHLGQGRDRHRALRRVVARHQAEGRRGARRDRLPDLLRSRATTAISVDDVFPDGPMRNKDGVQRGSVMDMPTLSGRSADARSSASVPGAKRLDRQASAPTLTKIPVLPISYGDAQPLLAALGGPVVPADWRGALPITYRIGPGPARVHLKLAFDWDSSALYNVIARLAGLDVSGRVDRSRQPSRRVGERRAGSGQRHGGGARRGARARRARASRVAAEADDRLRRLGRRRAGAARIDRVGRAPRRTSCATRRSSTSTPTATAAAS